MNTPSHKTAILGLVSVALYIAFDIELFEFAFVVVCFDLIKESIRA